VKLERQKLQMKFFTDSPQPAQYTAAATAGPPAADRTRNAASTAAPPAAIVRRPSSHRQPHPQTRFTTNFTSKSLMKLKCFNNELLKLPILEQN